MNFTVPEKKVLQSHTPFQDLREFKDKTVLVVGGVGDKSREAAATFVIFSSFEG